MLNCIFGSSSLTYVSKLSLYFSPYTLKKEFQKGPYYHLIDRKCLHVWQIKLISHH